MQKLVEKPQHQHDLLIHCYRNAFTHLLRSLGPIIFEQTDFQDAIRQINTTAGFPLPLPAPGITLVGYIDEWLLQQGTTITGIPSEDIPHDAKRRYTYPRRHGGFGFSTLANQVQLHLE